MKTIEFGKEILFDLLKDGKCIATDLDYRNFKINVINCIDSKIFLGENFNEINEIFFSKRDVIELLQTNKVNIDFTTISTY